MEPGHSDEYFIKKPKEKRPHKEKLGVFSRRYSYNYTLNRKTNSKMHKIKVFLDFQKKAGEVSLLPPLVVGLMLEGVGGNDIQFFRKPIFLRNWSLIKCKNISHTLSNKSIILCIYQNCLHMHHLFCECLCYNHYAGKTVQNISEMERLV